jgi:hypothetical protein
MPSRHELNLRARVLGFDPTTIANDSKLEQKVLYLEKNATTFTGTVGTTTLTTSGVFSDGETITLGNQTYTMKTALTASTTANQVKIGAAATNSLDNLKDAVNGTSLVGVAGTDYGSQTPANSFVTAGTKTASTLVFTAKDNSVTNATVATTETAANAAFTGTTLASGVAAVVATGSAIDAGSVKDSVAGLSGDRNVSV